MVIRNFLLCDYPIHKLGFSFISAGLAGQILSHKVGDLLAVAAAGSWGPYSLD